MKNILKHIGVLLAMLTFVSASAAYYNNGVIVTNDVSKARMHQTIKGKELVYDAVQLDYKFQHINGSTLTNRYPMFIIPLNTDVQKYKVENDGDEIAFVPDGYMRTTWKSFELKCSTNNFQNSSSTGIVNVTYGDVTNTIHRICPGMSGWDKILYWGSPDFQLNQSYDRDISGREWKPDPIRAYVNSTELIDASQYDSRQYVRYTCSTQLVSYPHEVIVILDPDGFNHHTNNAWCSSQNEELTWTFIKLNAGTDGTQKNYEKTSEGKLVWHPIQPVKWLSDIPTWAYTNNEVRTILINN